MQHPSGLNYPVLYHIRNKCTISTGVAVVVASGWQDIVHAVNELSSRTCCRGTTRPLACTTQMQRRRR